MRREKFLYNLEWEVSSRTLFTVNGSEIEFNVWYQDLSENIAEVRLVFLQMRLGQTCVISTFVLREPG